MVREELQKEKLRTRAGRRVWGMEETSGGQRKRTGEMLRRGTREGEKRREIVGVEKGKTKLWEERTGAGSDGEGEGRGGF